MNTITSSAKVMQNFTICLNKPVREALKIKRGDQVIMSIDSEGKVQLIKAASSFKDLAGLGKDSFAKLGGGEAFLKQERSKWEN